MRYTIYCACILTTGIWTINSPQLGHMCLIPCAYSYLMHHSGCLNNAACLPSCFDNARSYTYALRSICRPAVILRPRALHLRCCIRISDLTASSRTTTALATCRSGFAKFKASKDAKQMLLLLVPRSSRRQIRHPKPQLRRATLRELSRLDLLLSARLTSSASLLTAQRSLLSRLAALQPPVPET